MVLRFFFFFLKKNIDFGKWVPRLMNWSEKIPTFLRFGERLVV